MEENKNTLEANDLPQDSMKITAETAFVQERSQKINFEINSWTRKVEVESKPPKKRGRPPMKNSTKNIIANSVPLAVSENVEREALEDNKSTKINASVQNLWKSNSNTVDQEPLKEKRRTNKKTANPLKIKIKLSRDFYRNIMINKTLSKCVYCEQALRNVDAGEHSETTLKESFSYDNILPDSLFNKNPFTNVTQNEPEESPAKENVVIDVESTITEPEVIQKQESEHKEEFVVDPVNIKEEIGFVKKARKSKRPGRRPKVKQAKDRKRGDLSVTDDFGRDGFDDSNAAIYGYEVTNYDGLMIKKSKIHGNGIFAGFKIPKGALLMKYEGEVIGKCMSDKREKQYLKNGIKSIYMFKVDEDVIIDSTLMGNKARYINHSCNPNCYSITDLATKSILYISKTNIEQDEELTIDYHFTEDNSMETCNCGNPNCKSFQIK